MQKATLAPDWWWRLPPLTREGQRQFWDRQVDTYAFAEMTNDNRGELAIVEDLSDEFVTLGHAAKDVVTLGGAVGCRDPRVVVERLDSFGATPKEIHFNDLSPKLAANASAHALAQYRERGIRTTTVPGSIIDVAERLPKLPRRVLIGVYSADAFTAAAPEKDYPRDGFDEYLGNGSTLGDLFFLEWFRIESGAYVSTAETRSVAGHLSGADSATVKQIQIDTCRNSEPRDLGALRVVAVHEKRKVPFFLSHWFTRRGFESLMREGFGERAASMRIFSCAKGVVACLDPVGVRPQGILTVLNNVIGNVLPGEQLPSLRAINEITA